MNHTTMDKFEKCTFMKLKLIYALFISYAVRNFFNFLISKDIVLFNHGGFR